MRKLLMVVTMLLVPALASAWVLPVKVTNTTAGIAAGNKATVSYTGFAATDVTVGTTYFYPANTVASVNVAIANIANVTAITLDGAPLPVASPVVVSKGTANSHYLAVTYAPPVTQTRDITLNQTAGGLTSLSIYKSTTTTGYTGVTIGASCTIKAQPTTGYKFVKFTVNGVDDTTGANSTTAVTKTFTVDGAFTPNTVTAVYALNPAITAELSVQATAVSGSTATAVTAASANVGPINYNYTTTCSGETQNGSGLNANKFVFTPTAAGTCTVSVTVSAPGATDVVLGPANVVVSNGTANANSVCTACHAGSTPTLVTNFNNSALVAAVPSTTCAQCHTTAPHVAANSCVTCHTDALMPALAATTGVHSFDADVVIPHSNNTSCVGCHSVALPQVAGKVNDNNGVRIVGDEFQRWSHHVSGVALNDAHCAACHLEGKASGGAIVVDTTKHLIDARVHLRNADDDSDFSWNPEAPNFSGLDNFCMSCHDDNGATSNGSIAIQAIINSKGLAAPGKTASATNPFGDTISNQYDMEERPAVIDAKGLFATGNNSHHAVLGQKYSGRTRGDGIVPRTVDTVAFASNSSAAMPGKRSTIYDAGRFQADYTTLGDSNLPETGGRLGGATLGDDSTLHCADCHTVGQFAARGSAAFGNMSSAFWANSGNTAGITRYYKTAIGAHGSNNEYLLRNNVGTNARHQGAETVVIGGNADNGTYGTKPYLVCFNCHAFRTYGTVTSNNGETGINHAGEYTKDNRCNGPFNTVFTNMTGETRLRSIVTATSAVNNGAGFGGYGSSFAAGQNMGNAYGIQCLNCHNSGIKGNLFGGIHGSKEQTYTDGMGNTSKHIRFLPGLGNAMFAPGVKGGFTGGTLATYKSYSGSRDGSNTTATGAAFGTANQTFKLLPVRTIKNTAARENTKGSYQYVTGGVSNDLNWEQRTQQSIAGQYDLASQAMGCYTLTPPSPNYTYNTGAASAAAFNASVGAAPAGQQKNPKVLYPTVMQTGTGNVEDIRDAATTGITAGDGREMFDVWGGCDDHNGAQGGGTGPVRKVLRKISY